VRSRKRSLQGLAVIASLFVASGVMAGDKQLRLTPAAASSWMQGQSAVFFCDDVEQISYAKDSYFVLGFSESSTTGAYGGLWEASQPLSAINAEEFSKLGVDTVSLYDVLPAEEIPRLVAAEKSRYSLVAKQQDKSATPANGSVSEELRAALLAKGRQYLIWVNWDGFKLHVLTLGLKPFEQMTVGYRIFDLERNEMIANSSVLFMEKVDLQGATAKAFLEQNELQRFKEDVARLMRSRFTSTKVGTVGLAPRKTIPQFLGMPVAKP
jgi:hypothetical protein